MLIEYISAVVYKDNKYLVEAIQKEESVYGEYPKIRAVNAIADKKDILKFKMSAKYGIELNVGDCMFFEEVECENDVISYTYYICEIEKGRPFDCLIWVDKEDMYRVKFENRDNAATKKVMAHDNRVSGEKYE